MTATTRVSVDLDRLGWGISKQHRKLACMHCVKPTRGRICIVKLQSALCMRCAILMAIRSGDFVLEGASNATV
jgi:hypothetical protein